MLFREGTVLNFNFQWCGKDTSKGNLADSGKFLVVSLS